MASPIDMPKKNAGSYFAFSQPVFWTRIHCVVRMIYCPLALSWRSIDALMIMRSISSTSNTTINNFSCWTLFLISSHTSTNIIYIFHYHIEQTLRCVFYILVYWIHTEYSRNTTTKKPVFLSEFNVRTKHLFRRFYLLSFFVHIFWLQRSVLIEKNEYTEPNCQRLIKINVFFLFLFSSILLHTEDTSEMSHISVKNIILSPWFAFKNGQFNQSDVNF